jgi:hypothetical protein
MPCTGLDALKNLVTFKAKLALPLFFPNSRPEISYGLINIITYM